MSAVFEGTTHFAFFSATRGNLACAQTLVTGEERKERNLSLRAG